MQNQNPFIAQQDLQGFGGVTSAAPNSNFEQNSFEGTNSNNQM